VDAEQLIARRQRCFHELESEPALGVERRLDGAQALGVLGMRAGVVRERGRVAKIEPHGCTVPAP